MTVTSQEVFDRLQKRHDGTVEVAMTGWYTFGQPYAYQVRSVDGVTP
jgi:hypothetical protein